MAFTVINFNKCKISCQVYLKYVKKNCQIVLLFDGILVISRFAKQLFYSIRGQFCGQNERSENNATQRRNIRKRKMVGGKVVTSRDTTQKNKRQNMFPYMVKPILK